MQNMFACRLLASRVISLRDKSDERKMSLHEGRSFKDVRQASVANNSAVLRVSLPVIAIRLAPQALATSKFTRPIGPEVKERKEEIRSVDNREVWTTEKCHLCSVCCMLVPTQAECLDEGRRMDPLIVVHDQKRN